MSAAHTAREGGGATPLSRAGRLMIWANVFVVLTAGLVLYAFARDADEGFAWTIKAPITAAFLGAGYWGSSFGIALALASREWQRVRIVFVVGAFLTGLAMVWTLIYVDEFHLDSGSALQTTVAWVWFPLYLAEPWIFLALAVLHERRGGRHEYVVEQPLLGWFRVAIFVHAVALTAIGIAIWPVRADGFWPWTLPDIAAAAVATWILTFAVASWWCLREGDWRRARAVFPAYLGFLVFLLLAAARFSDALDGGDWRTWTYLGAIAVSLVLLSVGAAQHELVSRRAGQTAPARM